MIEGSAARKPAELKEHGQYVWPAWYSMMNAQHHVYLQRTCRVCTQRTRLVTNSRKCYMYLIRYTCWCGCLKFLIWGYVPAYLWPSHAITLGQFKTGVWRSLPKQVLLLHALCSGELHIPGNYMYVQYMCCILHACTHLHAKSNTSINSYLHFIEISLKMFFYCRSSPSQWWQFGFFNTRPSRNHSRLHLSTIKEPSG